MNKYLILLSISCYLGGCSVPRPAALPTTELPDTWGQPPSQPATKLDADWWKLYNDVALDALVTEALEHNRDLALAAARVDEARALVGVADASLYPTVDLTAQTDRTRSSQVAPIPIPASALERTGYRAQLGVSYEIDFWGRLRGAGVAARADLLASEAGRDIVRIALVADVVRGYSNMRAFDDQLATTRRTLVLREDNLKLQRVRAQAGLTTDYQLRQFEAETAAVRAQLPALERALRAEELALATLVGRSPRAITTAAITRGAANEAFAPTLVPEGLPSDLLLRRPDIAQAEQRLAAAGARIHVLRMALFPRIALTGYLGSESRLLGDLLSGPSAIWQLAFAVAQPVFQAGRSKAEIAAAEARERQALAQYQKAVQDAFREVATALSAQTRSREVFDAESTRVTLLTDALRLARIRFDNGLVSQLEIIDAERNLLAAQLNRIEALRAQRVAVADLSRALGGGGGGGGSAGATNPRTVGRQ